MAKAIPCPDCGAPLRTRTSRSVTPLYRQVNLQCVAFDCLATFGAEMSITHRIAPGQQQNPDLHLRQAPPRAGNDNLKAGRIVARDGQPPPANDDTARSPPGTAQN